MVASLVMCLSGCSWFDWLWKPRATTVSATAVHVNGSIAVAPLAEFSYEPSRRGTISPNRIENTAMSGIVMKTNIDDMVRSSMIRSLRLDGLRLDSRARMLSASIEQFQVDDVRSPAVWNLTMHYVVRDAATRAVIYERTHKVAQQHAKFSSNTIAIEDVVKANIDSLATDPAFVNAVKAEQ